MGKVRSQDFDVRCVGGRHFRVFKRMEDVVGVELSEMSDKMVEAWYEDDRFEEWFRDVAAWAWNSALEESGRND